MKARAREETFEAGLYLASLETTSFARRALAGSHSGATERGCDSGTIQCDGATVGPSHRLRLCSHRGKAERPSRRRLLIVVRGKYKLHSAPLSYHHSAREVDRVKRLDDRRHCP